MSRDRTCWSSKACMTRSHPELWIPTGRQRQHVGHRRRDGGPARADGSRRQRGTGRSHPLGRRTLHGGLQRGAPRHQQPVRKAQPGVSVGADRHLCSRSCAAEASIWIGATSSSPAALSTSPTPAQPGRDGPVDARRRGVLGSRLCLRQPRRPDRRARPGARAGRSNERQVTQGTLAPIDVVEAQTQVSRFQQAVFSGQQALTEAENRLKRLMLTGPPTSGISRSCRLTSQTARRRTRSIRP